ncbi:MAG: Transcriptional regulatory protein YehT [Firmicutes bacterium ADurb.Bin193]|nr:MAG: Transcriptional regulatory protein YehT [Firmicutes bacterium ADurb.Bin193]
MIKTIIVDDEWYTLEDIQAMAKATGFIAVCGMYEDPLTALSECGKLMPQVAFVDIGMPEMDGLTLAEKLLAKHPFLQVVFITAYSRYAVQAFELNALDYIMKPVDPKRFAKMAQKVRKSMSIIEAPAQNISIQCFGNFTVRIDDAPVKWERAKAEELFAYLLTNHNDEISKELIVDTLWPEYEPSKALAILQTAVWKLRSIFAPYHDKILIEYTGGKYSVKIKDCDCDLFYVENILNLFKTSEESDFEDLDKICGMVAQGYLNKSGFAWSYKKDDALKEKLCEILYRIVAHCNKNKDVEAMLKYLKKLVNALPCENKANIMLIELLLKTNEREKAVRHYAWLEKVLTEEYGVKPAKAIREMIM